MANYYLFRVVNEWYNPEAYKAICKELKRGYLRQGWGKDGTRLNKVEGEADAISCEEWISNTAHAFGEDITENNRNYYTGKYRNLSNMLRMEAGDIVIIPKVPSYNQFTICKVRGKYEFTAFDAYSDDDFRHSIPVDAESIREVNYLSNEYALNIKAKLRAYQSPVNNIYNSTVIDAADNLLQTPLNELGGVDIPDISEIAHDIRSDILKNYFDRFRNLGNKRAEDLVKHIFESMGYEFIGGNKYDREGGDADLIFDDKIIAELGDIPDNTISNKIYVQVKNKQGNDHWDIEGVKQLTKITEGEPGATMILISTADEFSQACKEEAEKGNVLLISSLGFLKLLMKYL